MPRYADPIVMDDGLNALKAGALQTVVSAGAPVDYADLIATTGLTDPNAVEAAIVITGPTDNIVTDGRKVTVPAIADLPITKAGTADHVCLVNVAATKLWYTTPISNPQVVAIGNKVNLGEWDATIREPTAPA